ncbi:hypothetical protein D3C71_966290 [compost metagenome]
MAQWSSRCSTALALPRTLWYRVDVRYKVSSMAAYTLQLTIFQGSPVRAATTIRMTPPMAASAAPTVWEMLLKRSPWYMA